jgi:hypothetical protein
VPAASIIRAIITALMMRAVSTSETSADLYDSARCNVQEKSYSQRGKTFLISWTAWAEQFSVLETVSVWKVMCSGNTSLLRAFILRYESQNIQGSILTTTSFNKAEKISDYLETYHLSMEIKITPETSYRFIHQIINYVQIYIFKTNQTIRVT